MIPSAGRTQFALAFVFGSLLALIGVLAWIHLRTQAIREEIAVLVEPARVEASRMVTQFDRELAAVRGLRLSGEQEYLARFNTAREARLTAERNLQPLADRLGPPLPALLEEFHRAADAWEASHQRFFSPGVLAEPTPSPAGTREGQYDAVISAGERMDAQLREENANRRRLILQEEQRGLALSALLAVIALMSALVVASTARRLGVFGRETERLYEESQALATQLSNTIGALQHRTAEAEAEIRERIRAEQLLHAEQARFRALADNIPQLAWMADPTGSIFWYNRRWREYTGTTDEEMRSRGWAAVHHPEHGDRVGEGFRRALAEARFWEDTFPLRGREGGYRWFLSRAMPIRDEEGRVTLWFGTNTDITEQREAHTERERLVAEIERQRRLLRTVTDSASSALLMMDSQGRGTFWNPAAERMMGYSADEVMGRTLHELIHHTHPDGRPFPVEECPIDLALPRGIDVEGYADVFIRKNGEFFPVVCAAKAIVEDGAPAGTVIEVRDVTEEKRSAEELLRAKEEAEAANNAKSEFLGTMSHELRTPLNAIVGYADLLGMGIPEPLPEKSRTQVHRINESARHLLNIIEQILTFSRIDAGGEGVETEKVDLKEVVRSAIAMIEPMADLKGVELVCELPAAMGTIRSDPQKLRQILINLIGNAVKFTERGTVELTVAQHDDELSVRVRDTGIGIRPEHLPRVFDPFWQVDQSNTRTAGGTGLGLTVSRSLARLLGGDVHAYSVPGEGSTFEVRLPLATGSDQQ